MNKIVTIVLMLLVLLIGVYFITTRKTSEVLDSGTVQTPTSNQSVNSSVTVSVKNFAFNPSVLNIKTGTTVIWVNDDSTSHTITSDTGSLLHSQTIAPGQSFSFVFSDPGSENYHCAFHPFMKGSILVSGK